MTQVKMFYSNDGIQVQNAVNDFLKINSKEIKVVDIKYSSIPNVHGPVQNLTYEIIDRVMIIYETKGGGNK